MTQTSAARPTRVGLPPEGYMIAGMCLAAGLGILTEICFELSAGAGWIALWVTVAVAGSVFTIGAVAKAVEVGIRAARR